MVELSIVAAILWGTGNFAMGVAARRSTSRLAVIIGFGTGTILAVFLLLGQMPDFSWRSVLFGCCAGVAQGLGWIAFAQALLRLRMAVAAPLAAVTTVASLFAISAALGNVPSAVRSIGVIVCLVAIVLLSRGDAGTVVDRISIRLPGPAIAVLAGVLFAVQALMLRATDARSSSLVLVGAGIGVLAVLGVTAVIRPLARPSLGAIQAGAVGGLAIFAGDLSFLYALRGGSAALASAIAQMHPIVTAGAAYLVLRELPTRSQYVGLVLALVGVALIST